MRFFYTFLLHLIFPLIFLRLLWRSLTTEIGWREFEALLEELNPYHGTTPLLPFLYTHGGYAKIWDRPELQDPVAPRSTAELV